MLDPEIEAIAKSYDLFKVLDDDSKIRVIQWIISKFELKPQSSSWDKGNSPPNNTPGGAMKILTGINTKTETNGVNLPEFLENSIESFESVADVFAKAEPKTEWEKALVVATYRQVKHGQADFTSQDINTELKNMGHGVGNITDVLDKSIDRKPQFILQMRKDGTSKQARKKYKVSTEGVKYVKALLLKSSTE